MQLQDIRRLGGCAKGQQMWWLQLVGILAFAVVIGLTMMDARSEAKRAQNSTIIVIFLASLLVLLIALIAQVLTIPL